MKKQLSPQQWSDWFITDGWLAYRALIEKRLETERQGLEAIRGARIEEIALQTTSSNSIIGELRYLIEILPENLENPRGEEHAERNGDRGRAGHTKGIRTRPGRDH